MREGSDDASYHHMIMVLMMGVKMPCGWPFDYELREGGITTMVFAGAKAF